MRKYLRIAVTGVLLAVIGWRTDWSAVADTFTRLRIELWFAAFGLYLIAQIASARRWQLFARELGFEQTLPQFCAYSFVGMYFSMLLPTLVGGDVARVLCLGGPSGRKWAAFASIFLERVNGLLILIATACVGVLISPVELPWWIPASVWGSAGLAFLGVAATRWWGTRSTAPAGDSQSESSTLQQMQLGWDMLRSPRLLLEASFMSILVQVAAVLILWCLGLGLGLDVPIEYYCVLVPMVSLLMLVPISLNGMGVREGATVLFLLPLGVEESAALTLAFLWFTTGVAVSLLGGVIYLFRVGVPATSTAITGAEAPASR